MTDLQSTAMIVMAELAGWCWLGAKWLWLLRHAQRTSQGKQAMQKPRNTVRLHCLRRGQDLWNHELTRIPTFRA